MGHTGMLLAVAGLNDEALDVRTRNLASGDWSAFPPQERAAFFMAIKLSREPWKLGRKDFDDLAAHFGTERAVDVLWWTCRCHYMTRVADAFQIPLEQDNPFRR